MADDDEKWLKAALSDPSRDAALMATGKEIALHPIVGWSTATLPEGNVMLGLQFLTPPPDAQMRIVRFAMKRAQCSELAKVLDRLAQVPYVLPPNKPS